MSGVDELLAELGDLFSDDQDHHEIKQRCKQIKLGYKAQQCCANIRCAHCDQKVLIFDERQWNDDTDYLFFRTHYPNTSILSEKLHFKPESCAYCCQCSWLSITVENQAQSDKYLRNLQWNCEGH